jgi:hypothetical protein
MARAPDSFIFTGVAGSREKWARAPRPPHGRHPNRRAPSSNGTRRGRGRPLLRPAAGRWPLAAWEEGQGRGRPQRAGAGGPHEKPSRRPPAAWTPPSRSSATNPLHASAPPPRIRRHRAARGWRYLGSARCRHRPAQHLLVPDAVSAAATGDAVSATGCQGRAARPAAADGGGRPRLGERGRGGGEGGAAWRREGSAEDARDGRRPVEWEGGD